MFHEVQKRKKKLLFVVEAMGGGVFTYIVDLANQLVDTYDTYIAYATRPQTPVDYVNYFDKRIHLIKVENFTRSVNPVKDAKAYLEIKRIEKEIKPDIIHIHSSKAGVLGRWGFNGHKIPLFYTPHGYSFLMQDNGWIKRTIYKIVETVSAKRFCTTISCSKGEHEETLKLTKRALYVNNGVNISELRLLIDNCETEVYHPFTVYTLGRACYQKNPEQFNEVAEQLPNVKFIWIGDGELKNQLTAPNIEITGWVNRKQALTYALQTDVFLLTSLWEGLPISLLESMYMKKLCVVSDVIGNHDVIRNGVNGFVCKSTDEIVNAIKRAMNEDTTTISNQAYNDIIEEYNTKVMGEKYCKIYKGIL